MSYFKKIKCTRPRWKNLQRSPDSLTGFKGPTPTGRGGRTGGKGKGEGERRERVLRRGKGREKKGEG